MGTSKRTYLVTGAAGLIGARFVESCHQRGIDVISVDKPEHFKTRTEHHELDFGRIIDREKLFETLVEEKLVPDAIVHMGACSDTMQLDEDYLRRMNLEYSKKIWNYAADRKIPLVYASSAATYGEGEQGYDDDEGRMSMLKPLNPYGESKRQFDLWVLEQEKLGRTPPRWAGFKFFNVYGFGERHKTRMASVILHSFDQIQKTGKVRLFRSHRAGIADGHQKRDFVSVEDVIAVMHFAVEGGLRRGIFNLGTGEARTFLDLARAVFAALGRPEVIEFIDTPEKLRERYQYFTEAKMSKLRAAGYAKPFLSLEEGVRRYIERLSRA